METLKRGQDIVGLIISESLFFSSFALQNCIKKSNSLTEPKPAKQASGKVAVVRDGRRALETSSAFLQYRSWAELFLLN